MNIINIEQVTKGYGERNLLQQVSLGINEHDKIGIVGINGTGKSTLLKVIAGIEKADEGTIITNRSVTISYLPQNPTFYQDETALEYVMRQKNQMDEWEYESDAKSMLNRFGIINHQQIVSSMSGGQKKRVALAACLLSASDVLLMDEPTNHLDSEMIEWLEVYLKNWKGVLVLVTHDRYFLDHVTNRIVEIDRGVLYSYDENYAGYLEKKALREEQAIASETKRRNLYRTELAWVRRGAQARSTKQKSRLQRFELLSQMKGPEELQRVQLESTASRLGKKTLEFVKVSKEFAKRTVVKEFSYNLLRSDRIGIIGPNGCGKTTLLNLIAGKEQPDSGYLEWGDTIKIGYFSQENEHMNPEQRVIDYVKDIAEYLPTANGRISASAMLERFLFTPEMQYRPIGKLSGGERRRLYLLRVLMEAPNLLVLDEPTNDLDIATLSVLEEFLDSFSGILITVSHDRYFLDRVVDRIFAFEPDGTLRQYEGGYTDYYLKCKEEQEAIASKSQLQTKNKTEKPVDKNLWKVREKKLKFTYMEQREFDTIDDDIAVLEEELAAIEKEMLLVASDYPKLSEATKRKEEKEEALEKKMERWVYLHDLAEKIEAQSDKI